MAPKLWNLIPDSYSTIRSFKVFKNTIRKLDLSGYYDRKTIYLVLLICLSLIFTL